MFAVALSRSKHRTVGGGLPAICREPSARPAHAVLRSMQWVPLPAYPRTNISSPNRPDKKSSMVRKVAD